jgi:hypothetical protein
MIEGIMDPKSKYVKYMDSCTDKSAKKWTKLPNNGGINTLLSVDRYKMLSPKFIIDTYIPFSTLSNIESLNKTMEILEVIISKVKKEISKFKSHYLNTLHEHISKFPIMDSKKKELGNNLMKDIFLLILKFANNMIILHVYPIHTIVNSVINEYTPLDNITSHDPDDYEGRDIFVI